MNNNVNVIKSLQQANYFEKKILYFEKLAFQKESIRLIKRKFDLIPSKKSKKDFSLIKSVFLPMNNYYSKHFFLNTKI